MSASIKDVAARAGVSIATVSRVLSGKGYVGDEARRKVEEAVSALGYKPNRVARSLREQRSRVIGLILSDIRNPFFSEISRAVENQAMDAGYGVLICNADEDPEKEARYLDLMAEERVSGVLVSPTRELLKRLAKDSGDLPPLVLFDRTAPRLGIDSVVLDNADSAERLTRCLIDGGFARIAGVFGTRSFTSQERLKGFRKALAAAGLEPAAVEQVPAFEAEGERVAASLLDSGKEIDAFLCSSALLATGCFRVLRQRGFRIPDEIGFACFDDPAWAGFVDPPVTVLRQPARLIGETAAELLLKRIDDDSRPASEIHLQGELIERESSHRPSE